MELSGKTSEDEAGGNAMRRPPTTGLVVFLLLGLSGCAGAQPRLSWSSLSAANADRTDAPTPNRFSWWRRLGNEPQASASAASGLAETSKTGSDTGDTKGPVNVWPDSRSE